MRRPWASTHPALRKFAAATANVKRARSTRCQSSYCRLLMIWLSSSSRTSQPDEDVAVMVKRRICAALCRMRAYMRASARVARSVNRDLYPNRGRIDVNVL